MLNRSMNTRTQIIIELSYRKETVQASLGTTVKSLTKASLKKATLNQSASNLYLRSVDAIKYIFIYFLSYLNYRL